MFAKMRKEIQDAQSEILKLVLEEGRRQGRIFFASAIAGHCADHLDETDSETLSAILKLCREELQKQQRQYNALVAAGDGRP